MRRTWRGKGRQGEGKDDRERERMRTGRGGEKEDRDRGRGQGQRKRTGTEEEDRDKGGGQGEDEDRERERTGRGRVQGEGEEEGEDMESRYSKHRIMTRTNYLFCSGRQISHLWMGRDCPHCPEMREGCCGHPHSLSAGKSLAGGRKCPNAYTRHGRIIFNDVNYCYCYITPYLMVSATHACIYMQNENFLAAVTRSHAPD